MTKRETILNFLHTGSVVRLYIDPRPADVIVPTWLKQQEWLCLDIGLPEALARPIPDLYVGVMTVYGTLSFGGCGFACTVPYACIHAARHMTSGEVMSWTSSGMVRVLAEPAPVQPASTPGDSAAAPVINLAEWRRARGR